MISIERFFENHLNDPKISSEELRQFVEDHLGKLKSQQALPVALAGLIAPTESAFTAFDAALSARTTLQAMQSSGTISKDDALQLIRTTVRQREGRVRDKFERGSAEYAEFFPQGLTEFAQARMGQVPALLDRLVTAAQKHQAALGPELLAEFTALRTKFSTAREGQVDIKGDLSHARAAVTTARRTLELQVGRNLLAIASHHLGEPNQARAFFTQSLLEDPTRSEPETTPVV